MIIRRQCAAILALLACSALRADESRSGGSLIVHVSGLRSDRGEVRIGLYQSADSFEKGAGHALGKLICQIMHRECEVNIPDLPFGTYALMVGHDVDGDGKISWSPLSDELKGVSNYDGKLWWPPSFSRASFLLERDSQRVDVRVF